MLFFIIGINLFVRDIHTVEILVSVQTNMDVHEIDVIPFCKLRPDIAGAVRDQFNRIHISSPPPFEIIPCSETRVNFANEGSHKIQGNLA